jgi:hypothetical protein
MNRVPENCRAVFSDLSEYGFHSQRDSPEFGSLQLEATHVDFPEAWRDSTVENFVRFLENDRMENIYFASLPERRRRPQPPRLSGVSELLNPTHWSPIPRQFPIMEIFSVAGLL